MKNKISLFSTILFYWMGGALFCSVIYVLLLSFISNIVFFDAVWAILFSVCFVLLTIIFELWYFIKHYELSRWKRDERKKDFYKDIVILTHSESVEKSNHWGITNLILFFINFGKGTQLHRFYYKSLNSDSSAQKYFYYIVDEDILQYFQKVTDLNIEYWNTGFGVKKIKFEKKLYLEIVYGSKSRVLKELHLVKDEFYKEEFASLIEKLNPTKIKSRNIFQKFFRSNNVLNTGAKIKAASKIILLRSIELSMAIVGGISYIYYLYSIFANIMIPFFPIYTRCDFFIVVPLVIFGVMTVYQAVYYLGWHGDLYLGFLGQLINHKKKSCVIVPVRSETHKTMHGFSLWNKFIFPQAQPDYQKLMCKIIVNTPEKRRTENNMFVHLMLTKEKMEIFKELYSAKKVHRYIPLCDTKDLSNGLYTEDKWGTSHYVKQESSFIRTGVTFGEGVPIIIVYNKVSKELKSMAPVEGYDYTEAQLAAIEKFNTLYP